MKRPLSTFFLTTTIALCAAGAHAANAQPDTQGLTRAQVKAQLYQAFLNGTTAADEKTSYPSPPSDRAAGQGGARKFFLCKLCAVSNHVKPAHSAS
ncbi:MAG: DUF4148 domain-containing protein [Paraburkholderia sp.]